MHTGGHSSCYTFLINTCCISISRLDSIATGMQLNNELQLLIRKWNGFNTDKVVSKCKTMQNIHVLKYYCVYLHSISISSFSSCPHTAVRTHLHTEMTGTKVTYVTYFVLHKITFLSHNFGLNFI